MKLGAVGLDKSQKAMAVAMIPVVGLLPLVRGGETQVPKGTLASAKLAESFVLDGTPAAAATGIPGTVAAEPLAAVPSAPAPPQAVPDVPPDHATNLE